MAFALTLALSLTAHAVPASVVVEIDAAAERVVDSHSARRLVPLELSDVAVPPGGGPRRAPVLFFRVLGRPDRGLRIELWERGEFYGARTLSGAGETPQLVARRVALAAAELGRRLARKREALLAREDRLRKSREAQALELRERTRQGPVALRSELALGAVPGNLWLFGQRLNAELSVPGPLRLDVGAELWQGVLDPDLAIELQGLSLGPAYRVVLTRRLDLDFGLHAAALILDVPAVRSLDTRVGQNRSWTARLSVVTRLELGLARHVRAFLGIEAGGLLRPVPYQVEQVSERLRGVWWGTSLGVVVTPPS